jgi:hypothetical protein
MGVIRRNLIRFGSHGTRAIGALWGETFPFYYVMEYQKSGGTWLGGMLADYLQIPFPQHNLLPMACSCVVHGHWPYTPGLRRVFYLYRDGRDVMVSLFFYRQQLIRLARERGEVSPYEATYRRLFGPAEPWDPAALLPRFMEHEARHPTGTRRSWSAHVADWIDRPHVVALSYESLLTDAAATLARVIPQHAGRDVDPDRLRATIDKFSFQKQTGRRAGHEDRADFRRKGVAGDWKNHFGREAAEVFDHHFGDTLVRLGYEPDRTWIRRCA